MWKYAEGIIILTELQEINYVEYVGNGHENCLFCKKWVLQCTYLIVKSVITVMYSIIIKQGYDIIYIDTKDQSGGLVALVVMWELNPSCQKHYWMVPDGLYN